MAGGGPAARQSVNLYSVEMSNFLMALLDENDRVGAAALFQEWLRIDDLKRDSEMKSQLARFMLKITENGRADLLQVVWETDRSYFLLNFDGNLCVHQAFKCNYRKMIEFFIAKATEQDGLNLLEKRNQEGNTLIHLLVERGRIDLLKAIWDSRDKFVCSTEIAICKIEDLFSIRNSDGKLFTHMAADDGNVNILEYFFSNNFLHLYLDTDDGKISAPIDSASQSVKDWMDPDRMYSETGSEVSSLAHLQRIHALCGASKVVVSSIIAAAVKKEHLRVLEWLADVDLKAFRRHFVPLLQETTVDPVDHATMIIKSRALPQRVCVAARAPACTDRSRMPRAALRARPDAQAGAMARRRARRRAGAHAEHKQALILNPLHKSTYSWTF